MFSAAGRATGFLGGEEDDKVLGVEERRAPRRRGGRAPWRRGGRGPPWREGCQGSGNENNEILGGEWDEELLGGRGEEELDAHWRKAHSAVLVQCSVF